MRIARGSEPPRDAREWLTGAVRASFPRLAAALGDAAFDALCASYFERARDNGAKLADFLAGSAQYPTWYGELAALERARGDVLHAPAAMPMLRRELTCYRTLRLVPATALVPLTTEADLVFRGAYRVPRDLDYPRTVLVWRIAGVDVCDRTVDPDEALGLRAAQRGTSLNDLATSFAFRTANPYARALDLVIRWLDAGVLQSTS